MKKAWILFVIFLVVLSLLVGCTGNKQTPTDKSTPPEGSQQQKEKEDEPPVIERSLIKIAVAAPANDQRYFWTNDKIIDFIKTKFGIEFEYEWYNEYSENMLTIAAANTYPEYMLENPNNSLIKKLGEDGKIVPINLNLDKLPNYRALYSDGEWMYTMARMVAEDENLYYVPYKRVLSKADGTYLYRKDIFDQLGLEFPKTLDEFTDILRILKDEKGVVPYIESAAYESLAHRAFAPSFRTRRTYLVDEDLDNEIVLGPSTYKYRDLLRYVKNLIDEGLLESYKDRGDEFSALIKTGQAFVSRGNPETADDWNLEMREVNPNVEWAYIDWVMEAYPGKPGLPDKQDPHGPGPVITDKATEEQIDRIFEFIDWMCTKEGRIFQSYGIEGESFVYEDGLIKWMPHIKHDNNPEGTEDAKEYSLPRDNCTYYVPSEWTVYDPTPQELFNNAFKDVPFVMHAPGITKPGESERYGEITEPVRKMANAFVEDYLDGKYDDTAWDEYISNINRAGYPEALELVKMAYDRAREILQSRYGTTK